jgi:uncharacterized protein YjbJ (UPF0337 family)
MATDEPTLARPRETSMNWDQIEGQWHQVKGSIKSQWGKLTDDDVQSIGGKKEKLLGILQQRYGVVKDEAEKQADTWLSKLASTKEVKP